MFIVATTTVADMVQRFHTAVIAFFFPVHKAVFSWVPVVSSLIKITIVPFTFQVMYVWAPRSLRHAFPAMINYASWVCSLSFLPLSLFRGTRAASQPILPLVHPYLKWSMTLTPGMPPESNARLILSKCQRRRRTRHSGVIPSLVPHHIHSALLICPTMKTYSLAPKSKTPASLSVLCVIFNSDQLRVVSLQAWSTMYSSSCLLEENKGFLE